MANRPNNNNDALTGWACAWLLVLALGLMPGAASAGDLFASSAIPEVLTPARLRQPQSEVPASVTVIDRELIEASGAREIYDVLKLVPGMNAELMDGNKPTVNYHASQALDSRRMLVLIDGRSVYQPGLARVDWNSFPITLNDVERIEVTRGPAAAAYGANAFLGVINIITRDPRDQRGTHVFIRQGNGGVSDRGLTQAGGDTERAFLLSVAERNDRGYDKQVPDKVPPHNSKRVQTANASVHWLLDNNDQLVMRTGASRTHSDVLQDASVAEYSTALSDPWEVSSRWFFQTQWKHSFSDTHNLSVQAYHQQFDARTHAPICMKTLDSSLPVGSGSLLFSSEMHDLFVASGKDADNTFNAMGAIGNPAVFATLTGAQQAALMQMQTRLGALASAGSLCGNLNTNVHETRSLLELQDNFSAGPLRMVTGASVRQDKAISHVYLNGDTHNRVVSLFTDVEWKLLDSWLINAGGYAEHDQDNGNFFSPRIANIFKLSPGQSIRFVYSEAIRTADMYENHADINMKLGEINEPYRSNTQSLLGQSQAWLFATQRSDGGLEAERIRSREVGYYQHAGNFGLDVRWFYEQLTDLASKPMNPFWFVTDNSGEIRNYGWETQVHWRSTSRQLWRATFAHINSSSPVKFEQRFVADNSGSLMWRYDFAEGWMFSTVGYFAHDWNEQPYNRYDATLAHTLRLAKAKLKLAATLRWKNDRPVVYDENQYRNNRQAWLSASLSY